MQEGHSSGGDSSAIWYTVGSCRKFQKVNKDWSVREQLTETTHLGQARWWPLMWAVSREVLIGNTVLLRKLPWRIQEWGETPGHVFYQLPRILLPGIRLGWEMLSPPERTLSQTKGVTSKITGQRQTRNEPHYNKTNKQTKQPEAVSHVGSPGFPYPAALPQAPLPNKVVFFVNVCLSSDNSLPSVRQESTL